MATDQRFDQSNGDGWEGQGDINNPEFGEDGKNTIKAISNGQQALAIAIKLQTNDLTRDIRRSRALNAFNGAAPYSDSDLLNLGQSYRYNVSFGFMEGTVGRAIVPYNDLSINIGSLTEIQADLPDSKNKIVQQEFDAIINKWGRWPKRVSRLNQDLVLNGYNCFIFPSDYDPFPVFVPQAEGYVDESTPNEINEVEVFVWKKSYLIHELYNKISDAEVAKKAGWDVSNVKDALESAMPEDIMTNTNSTSGSWTKLESMVRQGALWVSICGAKKVDTFHVFATELDGKVTHWIVLSVYAGEGTDGPTLFKKEGRFDSMAEFMVYFDLETGDGSWHGSRGLGQRAFNTHKAKDKIGCSILDQAFNSGQVIIQPQDQTSQEAFIPVMMGPFCVLPPDVTIAATNIPSIPETSFQADQLLSGLAEQRLGDVVPQIQYQPNQAAETATAAKIAAGRSQAVTQGNLKRYIDPISQTISIMLLRLLKKNSPNPYAKEFQEKLKKKGLSDEDLTKIRGARNIGNIQDILGNTAANTQVIFQEFRGDPDVDQYVLKEKRISSVLDADAADELLISSKDQTLTIEAMRAQEIEDTTIMTGNKVPVSARDNHEAHLTKLFQKIGTMVQQAAHNPDPAMIPVLKALGEHGNEHLNFLAKDKQKKAVYKEMEGKMKDTMDAIKMMEASAKKAAGAAINQAATLARTPEERAQVEQAQAQLAQA